MQRLTLHNLDAMTGLAGLADRTGVDIKPTLLRVLTDLYIQKSAHTEEEQRQFTELALRLIEVVDRGTLATVARRLRNHPDTPAAVLERLAQIVPVTAQDKAAGSIELFDTESVIEDDIELFEAVDAATPQPVAGQTEPLVPPIDYVGQREAFFSANAEERRLILMNLVYVAEQDVPLAQETSIIRYLEQAALNGRAQEFTTLLQQALGVSRALSRRIVTDPLGEPFVVAGKSLAMPTDVFQRILISLNPSIGQSVDRVFDLSDLFLELPLPAALHLVAIWRAADRMEARHFVHRPALWDDAPLVARRSMAHEPHQVAAPATHTPQRREPSRS